MFFGYLSILWLRVWFFASTHFWKTTTVVSVIALVDQCDCSGRPLPHVLNSRFVSEKSYLLPAG